VVEQPQGFCWPTQTQTALSGGEPVESEQQIGYVCIFLRFLEEFIKKKIKLNFF
jgi:hypothetical protein